MADFRKWFYALAVVALLAGLTVPASAQAPPFNCNTSVSVVPIVRAEGYTELVGDLQLTCNGGVPTTPGQLVPQANITVFLNTNVTSKVTAANLYNEALLLIDEPNFNLRAPSGLPANPILNCGNTGAADNGPSGPAVCAIQAPPTGPAFTYDGSTLGVDPGSAACATGGTTCNGTAAYPAVVASQGQCLTAVPNTGASGSGFAPSRVYGPSGSNGSSNGYGCGRPNVFQGRLGTPQNAGQLNAVTFLGVPLDPPGTTTTRTIRITNVRANAVAIGVSTTFTQSQIQANIAINSQNAVTIANPQQLVAYVNRGLTVDIPAIGTVLSTGGVSLRNRLDFIQCVNENPDLFAGTPSPNFVSPIYGGFEGFNTFPQGAVPGFPGNDGTPLVRFTEGFAASWKTKNVAFTIGDGTTAGNASFNTSVGAWVYNGNRNYPNDLAQNVPGAVYNTEAGFEWNGNNPGSQPTPNPNPPNGFASQFVNQATQGAALLSIGNNTGGIAATGGFGLNTGINVAGIASQGTRLSLNFTNIPSGAGVWLPPVIYLFRQGSVYSNLPNPNPTSTTGGTGFSAAQAGNTGVMVLTSTDAAGAGGFFRAPQSNTTVLQKSSGLSVYEILYTDPFSLEIADVPTVVAYQANVNQNLPTPGITTQVTGGFAPFYTSTAAGQPLPNNQFPSSGLAPSNSIPIPRFTPGTAPKDLFLISKCACNLLFPYVVSAAGFDTGIAIANSSADPGNANGEGFFGIPQPGTVTFWYYGVMASGGAVPGKQVSKTVPAGQVLTYVASSGSSDWGLDGRAAGLIGYVITQSQFQYCHAFAFISALGAGPLTPGTSEGYLGIVLDRASLNRTNQVGENKAH